MTDEFVQSLPESWRVCRLDEVATIIDSLHKTPTYSEVGGAMVRVTDVQGGFLELRKALRVTDDVFQEFTRRYAPKRGDIVFSRVGSYGNASYAKTGTPFCLGQNTALISPRVNGRFLHLFLQSEEARRQIEQVVVGSTQKTISLKSISALQIPMPPLQELEAIAAVLGALDDKIELNRRMNGTLEAMARALFQSWFVDFDPVRAKLDGRRPVGIDTATAALFPSTFQDSSLGPIPHGWRVVTVGETCENIFSGGTPSTQVPNYWGGTIPWLSSGETRGRFIIDTEKTITEAGVANSSTRMARPGCTVIAGAGQGHTRGQTSLLTFESYINQSVVALAANPKLASDEFLFFDLARRYEEFRQLSDSHSSRGSLTTKLLAGVEMVLPPRQLVEQFDKAAKPVLEQITANLHQSRTLATLRDRLLPKLISGGLRVAGAEQIVENA